MTSSPPAAGRLAPVVLALCVIAGLAGTASAQPSRDTTSPATRPPLTNEVDVPLREAVGAAAARRAPSPAAARADDPAVAPRLYPETRVAAVYGAPQLGATIVGKKDPSDAAAEAERLAVRYGEVDRRPTQPGIDLIATIATADPGRDGLYRFRQDPELVATYLEAARAVGARLALDIQPGRAKIMDEVRAIEPWLLEPDVDLSIDAEWNVGPHGVPNETLGSVKAKEINKASKYLAALVRANALPQKALYVHHFTKRNIRKPRRIKQRGAKVALTLNFDGIGPPRAKIAGYEALAVRGLFNGFSIFVSKDTNPMGFRRVTGLEPPVDYVMYQ